MERKHLLAAETYGYSFANYQDHLGIGNIRFETLMPEDASTLETAIEQGWSDERLAQALDVTTERAVRLRAAFHRAIDIVDAPDAAEAFRRGVRYTVRDAVEEGLTTDEAIEKLVVQLCYRAADTAFLLDREGRRLSHYSEALRRTTDTDDTSTAPN